MVMRHKRIPKPERDDKKSLEVIRTSDPRWLEQVVRHYTRKERFQLLDDARLGLGPDDLKSAVDLLRALKKRNVPRRQLWQVLTGIGISSVGIALVLAAILDPEPTSKLGILLAGGVVLILTGGLSILKALGQTWMVRVGKGLFTVEPKDAIKK